MIGRCGFAAALLVAAYSMAGAADSRRDPQAFSGGSSTVFDAGRESYGMPSPAMPPQLGETFFTGRNLFRQVWVVAPALDREVSGLGPLFNRPSCAACHLKNGRGRAPDGPGQKMTTMLVRLSIPGMDEHGGPRPHAVYGDQLNDAAIPGIAPEGQARMHWRHRVERFVDGETIELRDPQVKFSELAYGPMGDDILVSPRIAPPAFGLGLLEAVPEQDIRERTALPKAGGVRGKVNEVWDAGEQRMVLGRFGWKANSGSLFHQSAAAFIGDLGITSSAFPKENCTPAQERCRQAPSSGSPEIDDARLHAVILYQQLLAVPGRRDVNDGTVRRGERLFASSGCADCHLPELRTAADAQPPVLAGQVIHPYTDLLLHDMGNDLSDGRPDFQAGASEWRTPPLWGIGLSELVNGHAAYLHDGRARTLLEAILWHGGEAQAARQAVVDMPRADRDALLRFLGSL